MPWMFSSTLSFLPYLLGWLGFLVALFRGAFAAIAFTKPARTTCAIAYAAGVLIAAGDLAYLTDLARSVDSSWSGLSPVPQALIEPGGTLRSASHYAYPSVAELNASIVLLRATLLLLLGALAVGVGSLWLGRRSTPEGERPTIGESALLLMGAAGITCIALRFVV